jgi:CMP-N-acetylneuraminic acid synthetase
MISQGDSMEIDAFTHALGWLKENEHYEPEIIVKLFPTSPFRKPASIDKAIDLLQANPRADSVRSVRKCTEHPYKMWRVNGQWLEPYTVDKPQESHTFAYQSLPPVYVQNASIDVTWARTVLEKGSITGANILALVMDDAESIDINTPGDFAIAELIIGKK